MKIEILIIVGLLSISLVNANQILESDAVLPEIGEPSDADLLKAIIKGFDGSDSQEKEMQSCSDFTTINNFMGGCIGLATSLKATSYDVTGHQAEVDTFIDSMILDHFSWYHTCITNQNSPLDKFYAKVMSRSQAQWHARYAVVTNNHDLLSGVCDEVYDEAQEAAEGRGDEDLFEYAASAFYLFGESSCIKFSFLSLFLSLVVFI
jgi:hypothetical protein